MITAKDHRNQDGQGQGGRHQNQYRVEFTGRSSGWATFTAANDLAARTAAARVQLAEGCKPGTTIQRQYVSWSTIS